MTYPSSFALILQRLLRILSGGLNVVDGVFDVVFDPINHFTLYDNNYDYDDNFLSFDRETKVQQ